MSFLSRFTTILTANPSIAKPFMGKNIQARTISGKAARAITNGKDITFGNNVSNSKRRTRRSFQLNMFTKSLYSELYGKSIRMKVTNQGLRSIDKYGGLDNYLLKSNEGVNVIGFLAKIRKGMVKRVKEAEKREMLESTAPKVVEIGV